MKVYVNIKQIGKRKNTVDKEEYQINNNINTVRELIEKFVQICVTQFNDKKVVDYLLTSEIEDTSDIGKIDFGDKENKIKQDLQKAIDNAVQSYEDGIYRIFINKNELGKIDESVSIKNDDELTFVRLTMLAGRMW